MAFYKVVYVFGAHVAETILASVHVRAQQQAGRMDASDAVKIISKISCEQGGRPRMPIAAARAANRQRSCSLISPGAGR
ncbi:hypothetical protein, partial [Rhizobium sp. SEMIA 4085]|uniref:hypothetical protein n=1 Tax=Rhizobium sp. SEMIA 4085 TaxID=2137761 RepID=UPI001AED8F42